MERGKGEHGGRRRRAGVQERALHCQHPQRKEGKVGEARSREAEPARAEQGTGQDDTGGKPGTGGSRGSSAELRARPPPRCRALPPRAGGPRHLARGPPHESHSHGSHSHNSRSHNSRSHIPPAGATRQKSSSPPPGCSWGFSSTGCRCCLGLVWVFLFLGVGVCVLFCNVDVAPGLETPG